MNAWLLGVVRLVPACTAVLALARDWTTPVTQAMICDAWR